MSNSHVNIKGIKMLNKKVVAFLLKPKSILFLAGERLKKQ